jgi:hypothetical protein
MLPKQAKAEGEQAGKERTLPDEIQQGDPDGVVERRLDTVGKKAS